MKSFLGILLIGWAVAFFGSFIAFYLTPSKDFGLAAGWNKVGVFMTWQGIATVLALLCLFLRWSTDNKTMRIWAAVPAGGFALLTVAFGGLYFWASAQSSAPVQAPTQQPAATVPADSG